MSARDDVVERLIFSAEGHVSGEGLRLDVDELRRILGEAYDAGRPPVRAKKPAPIVEPFAPNTGDPALDDFMRRKHDPTWKPPALPKPTKPAKLTAANHAYLEREWSSAVKVAESGLSGEWADRLAARLAGRYFMGYPTTADVKAAWGVAS